MRRKESIISVICPSCGKEFAEDKKFCTECGATITAPPKKKEKPVPTQTEQAPPVQQAPTVQQTPPVQQAPTVYQQPVASEAAPTGKYAPITTGGYVGIILLMCIPIIGLILTIVWACGGCKKTAKKNFAKATLILMLVSLVLSLVVALVARFSTNSFLGRLGLNGNGSSISSVFGGKTSDDGEGDGNSLGSLSGVLGMLTGGNLSENDLSGLSNALGSLSNGDSDSLGGSSNGDSSWILKDIRKYEAGEIVGTDEATGTVYIATTDYDYYLSYLDQIKADGFYFEDLYGIGMSESEWFSLCSSWQGTNGRVYASAAYYDEDTRNSVGVDYNFTIVCLPEKPEINFN